LSSPVVEFHGDPTHLLYGGAVRLRRRSRRWVIKE
jgi:hypothetical protein